MEYNTIILESVVYKAKLVDTWQREKCSCDFLLSQCMFLFNIWYNLTTICVA